MHDPSSKEQRYDGYVQEKCENGIIPFKTLLIALVAVLCVSIVIMLCLFGALKSRGDSLPSDIDYETEDTDNATESITQENVTVAQSDLQITDVEKTTVSYNSLNPVDVVARPIHSDVPLLPIMPIEEPDVYASYTDDTVNLSNIRSEFAILLDLQENKILAHKNGDEKMYPASMTKVMTMIVAYENITDFNEYFTITAEMTDPPYLAGASVAGFKVGESLPLIDIMYGIALPSGADATYAVAFKVSGSEEAFAELMNKKAEELGLKNTHFVNASGLHHPDHYTTPHDMAIIMRYAMSIPLLEEIMSTYRYRTVPTDFHPRTAPDDEVMDESNITDDRLGGLLLTSTMFSRMYGDEAEVAEIIAGKTGYTNEAHNCLASVAETPAGKRYLLVTGNALSTAEEGNYGAVYDAFYIYKNYIPQS